MSNPSNSDRHLPDVSRRQIKAVFLCQSDSLGGAAVVTNRLVHAICEAGVDARLVVFKKMTSDQAVEETGAGRFRRGTGFMLERMRIAMANGFSRENLFKVSIASDGLPLHRHPAVKEADVIVLSWINQGMLSIKGIERLGRLGKPIVWVMHDMWNLTGICHHALECHNYTGECGRCQFLGSKKEKDLSRRIWHKKQKLYGSVPITFVAVSNWLADCCRKSGLMNGLDVRVIPNAFPIGSFVTQPTVKLQSIPSDKRIILMGAARLDDPIKGFDMAVSALNKLFDNNPEVARDSLAVFFGALRNPDVLADLRFPHLHLGTVNDGKILREIYAMSSVVLSTSLYETLPGTLIEGQAAGCLPVTFGRGGQSDIVDHRVNGYIARYKDIDDFAAGILWALGQNVDRDALHESVRHRFSSSAIASRFVELFNELLEKK